MKKLLLLQALFTSSILMSSPFMHSCAPGGGSDKSENQKPGNNNGDNGGGGNNNGGGNDSGGGNDNGGDGDEGTNQPQKKTYLYYDSSLHLVDADNINLHKEVTSNELLDHTTVIDFASFDQTSKDYTNLHRHEVCYIEDENSNSSDGGVLKCVSLRKDEDPRQVSNGSGFCDIENVYEDAISEHIYMVLTSVGSDGICDTADDTTVFVNSMMDDNSAPISLANIEILAPIHDFEFGEITGFYILQNDSIKKCNMDLSNCTDILSSTTEASFMAHKNGDYYICAESSTKGHSSSNGNIYKISGTNIENTDVSCSPDDLEESYFSGNEIYFLEEDKLKKFDTVSKSVSTLYINVSNIVGISDYHIVVKTRSGIEIVKKDQTHIMNIYVGDPLFIFSHKNHLLYSTDNQACMWMDDGNQGTTNCIDNSQWIGVVASKDGKINDESIHGNIQFSKILRLDGNKLIVVDFSDPLGNGTVLGQLPPGYKPFPFLFKLGDSMLLSFMNASTNKRDIFFVDVTKQNSLVQITNTPNEDEEEGNY